MQLTKYDRPIGVSLSGPEKAVPRRQRGMFTIIGNEAYRADLGGKSNAPAIAQKWGVSVNTVRQHRCNLRKRGEL